MIDVYKALELIAENTKSLESEKVPVDKSFGLVLANDVFSEINMPPFSQSAMDGYAFKHDDLNLLTGKMALDGESKTGDKRRQSLTPQTCMRIFTGAALPEGADTVVMQELVSLNEAVVTINHHHKIKKGANVRPIGDEIKKGEVALKKGDKINAATIGFLVTIGIKSIEVFRKPKVGIAITGDELVDFGKTLEHGQIYESNSMVLKWALTQYGIKDISVVRIKDEYSATVNQLRTLLNENDVVISCGGISVGDYDFVGKATEELKIKQVFYKVKQKPGKPLFYGKLEDTSFFALPGNPGSMLTCFYIYLIPALNKLNGLLCGLKKEKMILGEELKLKGDRAHFIQARINNNKVYPLKGQSSFMLRSFAIANALIHCDEGKVHHEVGDVVDVYLIPEI